MLSSIDVHYLVGVLVSASAPDRVEIELGGMVYDAIAEEERDVDVTATYKDEKGLVRAFAGIEVKAHKRPLDVGHIEQLVAKLNDMPSVTYRSIVSASGFTKPSRRKAIARGVELFHLRDWADTMGAFQHTKILPNAKFNDWNIEWHEIESAHFVLPDSIDAENYANVTPRLCNAAGETLPISPHEFRDKIIHESLYAFIGVPEHSVRVPDKPYPVEGVVNLDGDIFLDLDGFLLPAKQMQISGAIIWRKTVHKPVFKVLIKDGEEMPFVGGFVSVSNGGDIYCVTTSNPTRTIQVYKVSLSDRNKKKIYREKGPQPVPFSIAPLES